MPSIIHAELESVIMGKMSRGEDLIETLTGVAKENDIKLGRIEGLGAVESATLAFYNQESREYETIHLDQAYEITNLIGNISMKDGEPMVHAHVTLADNEGRAFGGHLLPGTLVFACEFIIQPLKGPALVRGYDEATGLPLWDVESAFGVWKNQSDGGLKRQQNLREEW